MIETLQGLGANLKLATGIAPQAIAAGTTNGTGVDRRGQNAVVIDVEVGATAGVPTSFTKDVKIQHSDTVGSGYVDFVPVSGSAASGAVAQITAASSRKKKSIDLRGAKQYVRVVDVTAFVGGTSPTILTAAVMVFGAADTLPAQADD